MLLEWNKLINLLNEIKKNSAFFLLFSFVLLIITRASSHSQIIVRLCVFFSHCSVFSHARLHRKFIISPFFVSPSLQARSPFSPRSLSAHADNERGVNFLSLFLIVSCSSASSLWKLSYFLFNLVVVRLFKKKRHHVYMSKLWSWIHSVETVWKTQRKGKM